MSLQPNPDAQYLLLVPNSSETLADSLARLDQALNETLEGELIADPDSPTKDFLRMERAFIAQIPRGKSYTQAVAEAIGDHFGFAFAGEYYPIVDPASLAT